MKERKAEELGIGSDTVVLSDTAPQEELLSLLKVLGKDPMVHGILIQAPLPSDMDAIQIVRALPPEKDVDGFHPINMGKLLLGDPSGFRPCTPAGIIELLSFYQVDTCGADVVILGRGNIVGKPLAALLMQKGPKANATVTVVHSSSRDIPEHTRRADIVVCALGKPAFLRGDMIKPGAVVVDVGVSRVIDPTNPRGYRLIGDVDVESVSQVAGKLTPNPGGVGPMTIAMLLANTVDAAERLTFNAS